MPTTTYSVYYFILYIFRISQCSELWQGQHWLTDPQYHAASAQVLGQEVYPGDLIGFQLQVVDGVIGRVRNFFTKVQHCIFTTIIQSYSNVYFIFIQDGILSANVLVFLDHDQLRQVDEEMDNVPSCVGEHCFVFCMQDILLAVVDLVRPYLPSRIFMRDNNRWRAASEVFNTNNNMFAYH